jgi:hypothetical protein
MLLLKKYLFLLFFFNTQTLRELDWVPGSHLVALYAKPPGLLLDHQGLKVRGMRFVTSGTHQHFAGSGIGDAASHGMIVSGVRIGMTLPAQTHHIYRGQKTPVFGSMGNMAGQTVFGHRRMRLLSAELISIVTLEAESLGRSVQQGLGVSRVGGVTVQTSLFLVDRKVDDRVFKLVYLV